MITISILGVDPYLVRQISKAMTGPIASLYETSKDNINFYAPECLYIHDGVEQNTWNVLIRVHAPLKVKVLEEEAVEVIKEFVKDACVNLAIEFYYYSSDNRYEFVDPTHPRFMTEENLVTYEEDDSCDCCDDESCEEDEGNYEEPYLGNVFENLEEKLGK